MLARLVLGPEVVEPELLAGREHGLSAAAIWLKGMPWVRALTCYDFAKSSKSAASAQPAPGCRKDCNDWFL